MAIKTYNRWVNVNLSANFNLSEFRCNGGSCGCTTAKVDSDLVDYCQKIRDHFGKPVTVSSGYRCPSHNSSVNGATSSKHVAGQAADIVVQGIAPREVAKYAESIGVKGIGLYETASDGYFVHIDTRENKSFWYGQAQTYRSTFGGAVSAPTTDDGYTLDKFISDVQNALGANLTGAQLLNKTITVSRYKNNRHAVVKALQKRLNALGFDCGTVDGIAGAKFTAAVKAYQNANGCVSDGEVTAKNKTWKKLLGLA